MFNRLAAIRMNTAEKAFSAGRLEEALEMAGAADLAGQRRAKELLGRLVKAFLDRGQERLLNREFAEALADFDRAARCGERAPVIEEWRDRASRAMHDDHRLSGQKQAAMAEARKKLAAGSIAGATDALAKSPVRDADGAALSEEIDRQTDRAEQARLAALASLKGGQVNEAVRHLEAARGCHAKLKGIAEVEEQVLKVVLGQSRESFCEGRLDRARQELAVLGNIGCARPDRIELEEALRLSQEAADALSNDRFAKARVLLGRMSQLGMNGRWIGDVRKQLEDIESQRRLLLEGPLGLLLGRHLSGDLEAMTVADATMASPKRGIAPPVIQGAHRPRGSDELPRRIIMRIDGVGSFLLLRGDRISVGRSGPGASADLQLISDLSERHAEIIRAGDDYFVASAAGVELAGRAVEHALLQDGDRVRFGQRIRLKFLRPSLKSPAAVLELGEGVRTTSDCRRVILWSGPLLLGGTRECHVLMRGMNTNAVLLERSGRIALRQIGPGGSAVTVSLGTVTEFGELRLRLHEADGSGLGKVIG